MARRYQLYYAQRRELSRLLLAIFTQIPILVITRPTAWLVAVTALLQAAQFGIKMLYLPSSKVKGRQFPRFDFDALPNPVVEMRYRFTKSEIRRLAICLRVPDKVSVPHCTKVSGLEALCIMLRRLCYPNRWVELVSEFGISGNQLSAINLHMVDHVYRNFGRLLMDITIFKNFVPKWCSLIHRKCGYYTNCYGFIDGTLKGAQYMLAIISHSIYHPLLFFFPRHLPA